MVQDEPSRIDAKLWLGILLRIKGEDSSGLFETILSQNPDNRIALLNLCAVPITWIGDFRDSGHPKIAKAMTEKCLGEIRRFLAKHTTDSFGRLIEILLTYNQGCEEEELWAKLERLYLDDPIYTPTLAVMAYLCRGRGRRESAIDFALEAVSKCPKNWPAILLLHHMGVKVDQENELQSERKKRSSFMALNSYDVEAVLSTPYSIQDPLGGRLC
jgi:hypothetical protein